MLFRSGRAGRSGEAVSLVCVDEHRLLRDIERVLKREIPRVAVDGFEPDPTIAAEPIQNGRSTAGGARRGGRDRPAKAHGAQAVESVGKPSARPAGKSPARFPKEGRHGEQQAHSRNGRAVQRANAAARAEATPGRRRERPALFGNR